MMTSKRLTVTRVPEDMPFRIEEFAAGFSITVDGVRGFSEPVWRLETGFNLTGKQSYALRLRELKGGYLTHNSRHLSDICWLG